MSVIKCGFEIEITDDKKFLEAVGEYCDKKPTDVSYDDVSNFIKEKIFDDFSYGSGYHSHQIRTDNQIADIAVVRGIETDGGFYTSIECDEIVAVADKMYDDEEVAKNVINFIAHRDCEYVKNIQGSDLLWLDKNDNKGSYVVDIELPQDGEYAGWNLTLYITDNKLRGVQEISLHNDNENREIEINPSVDAVKNIIDEAQSIISQKYLNIPSWDYIEKNTLYVAKFDNGDRRTGTREALAWAYNDPNLDEIGEASWTAQPEDLQRFYKAFEHAWREGKFAYGEFKMFYDSWVKCPERYEPQKREPIGRLSDELAKLSVYDDLIIKNYDGQGAGNHRVGNFVEALAEIGTDFDVVEVKPKDPNNQYSYMEITVQTDDDKTFQRYDYEANRNAIRHDKYMGDGKYESIQTLSKKDVIKKDIEQQKTAEKGKILES